MVDFEMFYERKEKKKHIVFNILGIQTTIKFTSLIYYYFILLESNEQGKALKKPAKNRLRTQFHYLIIKRTMSFYKTNFFL